MLNRPDDKDNDLNVRALLVEADCRIRFAVDMLARREDTNGAEAFGGYDIAIVTEVLEDIAGTLRAAADHAEAAKR